MSTLQELVVRANQITQALIESGGELTPELELALSQVDLGVAEKIDGYSVIMERLEAESGYWKEKAAAYTKIARTCENIRERMKDGIKNAMQVMGKKEVQGLDVRFVLKSIKPKMILDEKLIPPAYQMQVTTTVIDKKRIEAELAEGAAIPGASLVPNYSLQPYANRKGK